IGKGDQAAGHRRDEDDRGENADELPHGECDTRGRRLTISETIRLETVEFHESGDTGPTSRPPDRNVHVAGPFISRDSMATHVGEVYARMRGHGPRGSVELERVLGDTGATHSMVERTIGERRGIVSEHRTRWAVLGG